MDYNQQIHRLHSNVTGCSNKIIINWGANQGLLVFSCQIPLVPSTWKSSSVFPCVQCPPYFSRVQNCYLVQCASTWDCSIFLQDYVQRMLQVLCMRKHWMSVCPTMVLLTFTTYLRWCLPLFTLLINKLSINILLGYTLTV